MLRTKRNLRQARAVSARGSANRPPAGRGLRVPAVAIGLSLLVSLAPDLTLAPTQADEPVRTSTLTSQPALEGTGPSQPFEPELPPTRPDAPPLAAPPASADTAARFQAALDAARYGAEAFGVTFAAVRDGHVVWAGSSGVARDGRTRLEPGSDLVIGSITKTFVAAAVLQLVEEGRIGLDDAVRKHLPEIRQVSRRITVRQLLDHTSGLADVFNDSTRRGLETNPERAWTSSQILASLHAPWYKPGQGWAYANTNYYLLGMIVERTTGSTLEAELDRRFLEPLGLEATRTLSPYDPDSPLPPAWATIFWASGAMTSSAGDLARWGDALYDDDLTGSAIVEGETADAMLRFNRDDYGLGVKRLEVAGRTGHGHTGLLNTYTALLLHLPSDDVTIAMLVNRTNVDLMGMLKQKAPGRGPSLLRLATDS
jgi:D-alanyl-D-alanine carboxypeptidase